MWTGNNLRKIMNYKEKTDKLNELNSESCIYLLDGFEDALIGYEYTSNCPARAIYDVYKCIDILMKRDKMTNMEAWEYFEYNTINSIDRNDNRYPILIHIFSKE